MKRITAAEAPRHTSPAPNGPTVSVCSGRPGEPQDVGLVKLSVRPGFGMAAHKRNGSDSILVPLTGRVGNPGDEVAEVLGAVGPASSIANVLKFPEA